MADPTSGLERANNGDCTGSSIPAYDANTEVDKMETVVAISAVITAIATGVMIWAVYVAPQRAFDAQWRLQLTSAARERRLQVFRTLMATRANALQYRHVEALNLIDVEFSEPSEKDIRDAWKAYLDHLNTYAVDATQQPDEVKRKDLQNQSEERRKDLLAELLQKMGARLGYAFDFTYLKGRAYYPQGHGNEAEEQSQLRKGSHRDPLERQAADGSKYHPVCRGLRQSTNDSEVSSCDIA